MTGGVRREILSRLRGPSDDEDAAGERIVGAGLRLTVGEAKNALYDNRTPKDVVVSTYTRPLKPEFVQIDSDMSNICITVRPPTPVGAAVEASNEEMALADD